MAKSPLELYQQAFELQNQQQVPDKEIIKQFPTANESAYAAIQLEKIMADSVSEWMRPRRSVALPVLGTIVILLLLAMAGMQYYLYDRLSTEITRVELTLRTLIRTIRDTQSQSPAVRRQPSSLPYPLDDPESRRIDASGAAPVNHTVH
jgi:hypothetical protein